MRRRKWRRKIWKNKTMQDYEEKNPLDRDFHYFWDRFSYVMWIIENYLYEVQTSEFPVPKIAAAERANI